MSRFKETRHVPAVKDLKSSAEHFMNVRRFSRDFSVEGWEFLSRGEFSVMLGECPLDVPAAETNNHSYFAQVIVDDVDALYDEYQSSGATFTQPVRDKPWGLREFGIVTPEGHRIVFGQDIE